jgi:hypothetical protein
MALTATSAALDITTPDPPRLVLRSQPFGLGACAPFPMSTLAADFNRLGSYQSQAVSQAGTPGAAQPMAPTGQPMRQRFASPPPRQPAPRQRAPRPPEPRQSAPRQPAPRMPSPAQAPPGFYARPFAGPPPRQPAPPMPPPAQAPPGFYTQSFAGPPPRQPAPAMPPPAQIPQSFYTWTVPEPPGRRTRSNFGGPSPVDPRRNSRPQNPYSAPPNAQPNMRRRSQRKGSSGWLVMIALGLMFLTWWSILT